MDISFVLSFAILRYFRFRFVKKDINVLKVLYKIVFYFFYREFDVILVYTSSKSPTCDLLKSVGLHDYMVKTGTSL